ncbi:Hypothetical protein SRAE_2000111800 [Strongyloides ratti]|uniref:Uncharacterized protein n=1 Tax=Strongyloides ratti TaxID=34506 RepID=A0A090LG04_STRRB|nr:Hypothetical protein SRAE_2000111800 [Strongyloides ratti]CEF66450.1 Hypothetical protein SRAE_2000111800 [Strongyloides ratti]
MFSSILKVPDILKQEISRNSSRSVKPLSSENCSKWPSTWKYVNKDEIQPSSFNINFNEPDTTTLKMLADEAIEKEPKVEMDEDDDSDSTSLTKSEYLDEKLKGNCNGKRLSQRNSSTLDEDMRVDGSFIIDVVGGSVKLEKYIILKDLKFDPFTSNLEIVFQKDVYFRWQHVTANTFRSVVHLKTRKLGASNMECCDNVTNKQNDINSEVNIKVQFATLPTIIHYFNRNKPYIYQQKSITLKHIELKSKDKKEIYRMN